MAFQGRQVSFESLTPLNIRAAPQHPVQYQSLASAVKGPLKLKAFAVLLKNQMLTPGTGLGATVRSELE